MKKKLILLGTVIAMILSGIGLYSMDSRTEESASALSEESTANVELVNKETAFKLVTIEGNKITFYDPLLRNELEANGIAIPPSEQERFNGKERVSIDDPEFAAAFYEFYSKFVFESESYSWQASLS